MSKRLSARTVEDLFEQGGQCSVKGSALLVLLEELVAPRARQLSVIAKHNPTMLKFLFYSFYFALVVAVQYFLKRLGREIDLLNLLTQFVVANRCKNMSENERGGVNQGDRVIH